MHHVHHGARLFLLHLGSHRKRSITSAVAPPPPFAMAAHPVSASCMGQHCRQRDITQQHWSLVLHAVLLRKHVEECA